MRITDFPVHRLKIQQASDIMWQEVLLYCFLSAVSTFYMRNSCGVFLFYVFILSTSNMILLWLLVSCSKWQIKYVHLSTRQRYLFVKSIWSFLWTLDKLPSVAWIAFLKCISFLGNAVVGPASFETKPHLRSNDDPKSLLISALTLKC